MGFGHRVYKNYDPRAKIIKETADSVFEVTGRNPLLDIALELERIALEDEYFVSRKLYPNVDFYSGLIYQALGLPVGDVPRAVRDPAHGRAGSRSGSRGCRPRAEDRPAPPAVHGGRRAGLRRARRAGRAQAGRRVGRADGGLAARQAPVRQIPLLGLGVIASGDSHAYVA